MSNDQIEQLEKRISLLEDEAKIRSLVSSFADAITRANYEDIPSLFDKTARFQIHHPANVSCNGIKETMGLLDKLRSSKDFFVHFIHSGEVVINGETAEGRFIIHEVGMGKPSSFYNTYVTASDSFRRRGKSWVFTERVFDYIWLDTKPFSGDAFKLPVLKTLSAR
ncbi:MAG TPA: nuclear transport factor 2 family protein [Candidatus Baltobacteraceae bacterium]|jgi:hypothetical protein|nr:nuclear transport factor 2 family protein [Candidatus Baltobacteraceae bacterium]